MVYVKAEVMSTEVSFYNAHSFHGTDTTACWQGNWEQDDAMLAAVIRHLQY